MINIQFPDGSKKPFEKEVNGFQIAKSISPSLAKKSLVMKVDGELMDMSYKFESDAAVEFVTTEDAEALEIIRHDAAHILAMAAKELFPDIQITIGPAIENGFYYDFSCKTPFTEEDLPKLEAQMRKIVKRDVKFERALMPRDEAIEYFKSIGEHYKAEIISDIPAGETITVYKQGDFMDLCRGPHAPSTGKIKVFKLLKVAGAYWRGDSNNEMLQRVYGTAWATQEQLDQHLFQLEEAEKRDHRKLGKEMNLFHFQEEAPGCVFWHNKGWNAYQALISYMRSKQKKYGYDEINTPETIDRSLWEKSGHWEKFGQNMYTAQTEDENRIMALKPMNCPGHVQVYKSEIHSYKELPIRLCEFGKVHRYEPSGALHGLMRVRAFTQDDAHIFCAPEQLQEECKRICAMILDIYKDFGFQNISIKFSDRPEKRIGSDDVWQKAEDALQEAAKSAGLECKLNKGEGAFYGPKLEFVLRDAIGRDWQIGTLQVDMNLPNRLGAHYVGEDGNKHEAVMLHQATFGSLERFFGILLEHYAGKLPLWMSPQQVVIMSITNDVENYATEVYNKLKASGIRAVLDINNDKIGYKIRKHSLSKIPVQIVVGKQEALDRQVNIRRLGEKEQENLELEQFISKFVLEAQQPI